MLTLLEGLLLLGLCGTIVYMLLAPRAGQRQPRLEERVAMLERQNKELRNAIAILLFKTNAFETQLPLSPEQKRQIQSLEDQITVSRYLDTIFPE